MTGSRPTIEGAGMEAADGEVEAFYGRTSRVAFGLALRITGDEAAAATACEAAYAVTCAGGAVQESEADFLNRVRRLALAARSDAATRDLRSDPRQPSYTGVDAIRAGLGQLPSLGRRSVELAYFGGACVADIAEILGKPAPVVRAALREALLSLSAQVRQGQESQP